MKSFGKFVTRHDSYQWTFLTEFSTFINFTHVSQVVREYRGRNRFVSFQRMGLKRDDDRPLRLYV